VPPDALGSDEIARKVLRNFRGACKVQERVKCFWLRSDGPGGRTAWRTALTPLLSLIGVPETKAAEETWVAAVPNAALQEPAEATAFRRTDDKEAQKDLAQWLQQLTVRDPERRLTFVELDTLPPLPEALEELGGPRGLVGKLLERLFESWNGMLQAVKQSRGSFFQFGMLGCLIAWPILQNMLKRSMLQGVGAQAPGNYRYEVGQEVTINGLQQSTAYNGQRSTVVKRIAATPEVKYQVKILDSDKELVIKESNLT